MPPSRGGVHGTTIDSGIVAQAVSGSPLLYAPNGSQIWFGPGAPIAPVAPAETPARAWDYPIFWNTYRNVDSGKAQETGGITMAQLRALANQTHVRALLETVKDHMCKKEWSWTVKPQPGEKPTEAEKRALSDLRIDEITDFFERPDGEHDFSEWLRMLLEDVLVLDAGVVTLWPALDGTPFRLEVYDGGTIVPLIDAGGRRPMGVDESGEPVPAFQQYIHGVPFKDFAADDLLYLQRNPRSGRVYGFSPVEQIAFYINIAMRQDLTRLGHFTDGNIPSGLLPMPPSWSSQQIEGWFNSFNAFVAGLPHNLAKIIPIPGGGGTPVFPQIEAFKAGDTWEETWIRLVCFAFGISPSSLVRQQNRATAQVARSQADEEGEQVYSDFVRRTLNRIVKKWFGYDDVIARAKEREESDPDKQSLIFDRAVKNGTMTIDEVRDAQGLDTLGLPPGLITLNGFVPFADAIAQAAAATESAQNPPPVVAAPPPEPPKKEEPPPEKPVQRVSIPTSIGKVLRFNVDDMIATKRGLVPVAELLTGDELVTLETQRGI